MTDRYTSLSAYQTILLQDETTMILETQFIAFKSLFNHTHWQAHLPALLICIKAVLVQGLAGQVAYKHFLVINSSHAGSVGQKIVEPAEATLHENQC